MKKVSKTLISLTRDYPGVVFLSAFFLIIIIGATLFHLIEGRGWFDSIYYAFILMSSVGFGDFVPTTASSKILTIIYGMVGIPIFIVGSGILIQKIFFTHFKHYIAKLHREIEDEIDRQTDEEKESKPSRFHKFFHKE